MTYEQMMLSIFSRYRGQPLDPALVSQIQEDCEREVWCHLPPGIREAWKLRLAIGETGEIELRPEQLKKGIVGELESALVSEFRERSRSSRPAARPNAPQKSPPEGTEKDKKEEPRGGIAAVSIAFGTPQMEAIPRPDSAEKNLAHRATEPTRPSMDASERSQIEDPRDDLTDAALIESMAKDLGISLPPNASLLGPFLVALSKAQEFKHRAEVAEAKLEQFTRLLQGQD